ncbi:hypothetical protein [Pseudomonas migulae]|uniref:Uncharacterized protein n=1 Tax=Pseudomonas migulae TaxID=78543 RepID=A0ABY8N0P9_9PSED|nr:hypothetical protein [Pseudomonas migulae]WGK93242.1 hypothetical protein MOQ58_13960 [Pseudomonas migulae]
MSNKIPENKYEVGTGNGQFDEVKNSSSSDFFEPCTSFVVEQGSNIPVYRYPVDYKSGKMVVTYFSDSGWRTVLLLTMTPPEYLYPIEMESPTMNGYREDGYKFPNNLIEFDFSYKGHFVGKHTLFFRSPNSSSSLDVFIAPNDLTRYTMYKLNGIEQGEHDLLLYYNEFYGLEFYSDKIDGFEFLESSKIKSISYDKDAPYYIDFIEDEELVENESGESSIEGLSSAKNKTAKMTGGVKGLRVRYKNPDNPYFGRINVTLHYKEGMVLKPPIEVVKRV